MLPTSECAEQKLLRERYSATLKAYWEMVTALDSVSTHNEFQEAYERAEGIRLLFVRTRSDLVDHIREHGCDLPRQEEGVGAS